MVTDVPTTPAGSSRFAQMAEETPLPDGWSVVEYKTRAHEYYYRNRITGKEVRVTERPTQPPPQGIELLRDSTKTGWAGVGEVGKKTIKYQARWRCSALQKVRALPGLHNAPDAAAALYEFIEAGAMFAAPQTAPRQFARNTKPQPEKRQRTEADEDENAARNSRLPTSVPMPKDVSEVNNVANLLGQQGTAADVVPGAAVGSSDEAAAGAGPEPLD